MSWDLVDTGVGAVAMAHEGHEVGVVGRTAGSVQWFDWNDESGERSVAPYLSHNLCLV